MKLRYLDYIETALNCVLSPLRRYFELSELINVFKLKNFTKEQEKISYLFLLSTTQSSSIIQICS